MVGVLLAVVFAVGWLGFKVLTVKTELETAQSLTSELTTQASEFDFSGLVRTTAELSEHSSAAAQATDDPIWRLAEAVPYIGDNLRGVRVVAESLGQLSTRVAQPAALLANNLELGADPATGAVDLTPLDKADELLDAATDVLDSAQQKVGTVDTGRTMAPVSDALTQLTRIVDESPPVIKAARDYVTLADALLGKDGPRNYLLAFQNNAEATALGGVSASFTLLHTDAGVVTITDAASSADFHPGELLTVPVDPSAVELTSGLLGYSNLATARPDFPTAGTLLQAYWARDRGVQVDGVISIDPTALAHILKATGPVPISDGQTLTTENAVQLLTNTIYFMYDSYAEPEKADNFFHAASAAVVTKVQSGDFDLKEMIKALAAGTDQGSIMVWSSRPDEQSLLDGSRLQGTLPRDNEDATVVGVYFRDQSASKLDYYLDSSTRTTSDICTATANPTITTTVQISSILTQAEADALPRYVQSYPFGSKYFGTEIQIYGPVGATLTDAHVVVDGRETILYPAVDDLGRPVAKFTVYLDYGQKGEVSATFAGGDGEYGPLEVRGTPMIRPTQRTVADATPCG